jgi:hypothetical protein
MPTDSADRTNAMLSLATALPKVTRRTLGRRGLAEGSLVTDWVSVVGPMIAERSLPLRLQFSGGERSDGTLHVRVSGALALELQHLEPQVLERINGYFGYRAVGRLRIHQGPVPPGRPAPQLPRISLAPHIRGRDRRPGGGGRRRRAAPRPARAGSQPPWQRWERLISDQPGDCADRRILPHS